MLTEEEAKKFKFSRSVSQIIRQAGAREARNYCFIWQYIGGFERPKCKRCRHRLLQTDCKGNPIGQREINEAKVKAEQSHYFLLQHKKGNLL